MQAQDLDPRLRLIQQAHMKGKATLLRVDHNVVKKGEIKDPYRIEVSLKTIQAVLEKGGLPILLTHIGRPRDKKTGRIRCQKGESVGPIVTYLEKKLPIKIHMPEFPVDPDGGILHLNDSIRQ